MIGFIKKTNAVKHLRDLTKDSWTGQVLAWLSTALDDFIRWGYRLWPPHILHNRQQRAILHRFSHSRK